MLEGGTLRLCICAAAAIIIAPLLATTVDAQRGHGAGGGGGMSHGGGMGGFSGMSHGSPMISSSPMIRSGSGIQSMPSSSGLRSLSTSTGSGRSLSTLGGSGTSRMRSISGAGNVTSKSLQGIGRNASTTTIRSKQANLQTHQNKLDRHQLDGNHVTKTVQGVGRAKAIQNTAFASPSKNNAANRALAQSTFHGQFAKRNLGVLHNGWWWWHRNPIIVIGWYGPLFWPYAYWDFIDYVFWPYAYDVFWPYVYDDVYVGIFGPYSYEGAAYAAALTDWPMRQITQVVEPNDAQQAALGELKDATAKAVEVLQSGCPKVLLSTPVGRVAAMRQRLETMLQAVALVLPPLEAFYASLSDEQKARFDAMSPGSSSGRTARTDNRPPDLSQACNEQAVGGNLPINRLEQALRPTDVQQAALG